MPMEELAISTLTRIHTELRGFVYRKVKDHAVADDIVQDVFLKVHARANQLKDPSRISSWIYQITRNTVSDYYREQSKTLNPVDLNWESDTQDFNECVAYCLNELVNTLPDKYRQALELTEHDNLSQLELADRLGISYSGAKSRVQRARIMLKEKLESLYHIRTDVYGNVTECENRIPCGCDAPGQIEFLNNTN
jgi:RNA polymerase sigma-70 factor (ECF subfamily)